MFRHFTLRFCGFPFVEIKDVSLPMAAMAELAQDPYHGSAR
jgi:hypothetical protein